MLRFADPRSGAAVGEVEDSEPLWRSAEGVRAVEEVAGAMELKIIEVIVTVGIGPSGS